MATCRFKPSVWRTLRCVLLCGLSALMPLRAAQLFVPMDQAQANHLKAYGVAYWVLQNGGEISWLLNYRGGAFLLPYSAEIAQECRLRDVSAAVLSDGQVQALRAEIASADV
ncbi:MAG: hypothetical protein K2O46_06395, partial [Bacteroidales bacterium]|nr:hypothetical protein [Bacteroidales bacterium]